MKNIIIVGGGMGNKGAQSMTFITVDELRKRFPQDRIVLLTSIPTDDTNYRFDIVKASHRSVKYLVDGEKKIAGLLNRVDFQETEKIKDIFLNARLLIDISGYALSSKWADAIVNYYLIMLECAAKFKIPVYVFPQSFGPFEYKGLSAKRRMARIQNAMKYPKVIFAREQEGKQELEKHFKLNNIRLSHDMVVVSRQADVDNVYLSYEKTLKQKIVSNSVAILPNTRNYDHGNKKEILFFYQTVIEWLLSAGQAVYLMRHSSEDLQVCKEIKEMFANEERVIVMEEDFDCFEYEEIVKNFCYIIASRYHSIIHAYKCNVPCIALGWATKYIDLLSVFEQSQYMFDVRKDIDKGNVLKILKNMNENFKKEKQVISEKLVIVQENNIFDVIEG